MTGGGEAACLASSGGRGCAAVETIGTWGAETWGSILTPVLTRCRIWCDGCNLDAFSFFIYDTHPEAVRVMRGSGHPGAHRGQAGNMKETGGPGGNLEAWTIPAPWKGHPAGLYEKGLGSA